MLSNLYMMSIKGEEVSPFTFSGPSGSVVQRVTNGCWALEHSTFFNYAGILCDMFNLEYKKDGFTTIFPFIPPIKVKTYTKGESLFEATNKYTEAEYVSIFEEEKQRFSTRLSAKESSPPNQTGDQTPTVS